MRDVISYLRARLDDLEAQAPSLHQSDCASARDAAAGCDCDYPRVVLADVASKRELIDEFVHWLESEGTSERSRGRTHRALLLLVQPWSRRDDFDPYWRVVDS